MNAANNTGHCDGCFFGLKLDGKIHLDADGRAVMVCNRGRYQNRLPIEASECAVAPAIKDHQIREAVDKLRDIARESHASDQLRMRISEVVVGLVRGGAQATHEIGVSLHETFALPSPFGNSESHIPQLYRDGWNAALSAVDDALQEREE